MIRVVPSFRTPRWLSRVGCARVALAAPVLLAALLSGCASTNHAPVEDRGAVAANPAPAASAPAAASEPAKPLPGIENLGKPGYYAVKPGDTLIRIGLENGQNWKDLVRWNNLENPNVIDSMGWLRYKQGVFKDVADGAGVVTQEGAVTLLTRAIRLSEPGIPNDAGLEHLGDAQWRAGLTTHALKSWREAATAREGIIQFYRGRDGESARAAELKDELDKLKGKIDAGAAGGQPEVAPVWPTTNTPAP